MQLPEQQQKKLLTAGGASNFIGARLSEDKAFLAARFGGIEGKVAARIVIKRERELDDALRHQARTNAGVHPIGHNMMRTLAFEQIMAGMKADLLAIWNYDFQPQLASFVNPTHLCNLEDLNPIRNLQILPDALPWTKRLSGQRVLVIHPFKKSIENQISNLKNIKSVCRIWPKDISFEILPPPVTFAGQHGDKNWYEELSRTRVEISRKKFDVAIIAAGAYGMPLGAFVKDLGLKAIHMGGAMQLMFGIIGSRWEGTPIERMFGPGWVRPLAVEVPPEHKKVDKSSYW